MDLLVDCSPPSEQRLDVVPNLQQQQQFVKSKNGSKKRKERHSSDEDEDDTKKRHRRTAHQIERKHRCEVPTCGKAYGSEGALKMHVRLKHSDSIVTKPFNSNDGTATTHSSPPSNLPTAMTTTAPQLLPHVWTTTVYGDVLVPVVLDDFPTDQFAQVYVTSPTHLPQDLLPLSLQEETTESNDIKELKEKFCYLPLLKLNIGLWQAESQCCGDLIAKFCYKERCIVWEIFDVGSLLRTVISFDNLNGVGLEFHADDTATLVIELLAPPTFFKGVLRPYESTLWTQISDFTEGMASTFRRHILHFSRRSLTDSIESIFQRDPRLQSLLLQGLPALKSPYFSQLETTPTPPPSVAAPLSASPPPPSCPILVSSVASSSAAVQTQEPNWNPTTTVVENDEKESDSSSHCSPIVITIESSDPLLGEEEATVDSLEVAVDELSKCALQSLQSYPQIIDSSLAQSKEAFELPCGHTQTIPLRALLLHENFCATCKESYYFSFCKKKPVAVARSWHCLVCNACRNEKEWHCSHCGTCTVSPPSIWRNSILCQQCCSALVDQHKVKPINNSKLNDNDINNSGDASLLLAHQDLRRNYRRKKLSTSSAPPVSKTCVSSSTALPSMKPQPIIAPRVTSLPPILPAPAPIPSDTKPQFIPIKPEIKPASNTTQIHSSRSPFLKPNLVFPIKTSINVNAK
eukprot:TRINITY_DN772_c0_g1_i1.p1 TRINITY_DN772_c0_g1~~TRINITY_DN772_c0_g1_i1.p1  ORF type:complete len:689 (-),score=98.29 TRINITY_DN772_c0_g1_i1:62-2128(-)